MSEVISYRLIALLTPWRT